MSVRAGADISYKPGMRLLLIALMLVPLAARADEVGVVGTWKVMAIETNGKPTPMDGTLVFTFRDDGTGTLDGKRGKDTMNETFKWWIEADELVTVDQGNQQDRAKYKRSGKTLKISSKGLAMTMKKTK